MSVYKLLLILYVCMAVSHLSQVDSGSDGPALVFISVESSRFRQGQVLYSFGGAGSVSYRIDFRESCSNDTFTIHPDTGQLSAVRTVNFTSEGFEPRCVQNSSISIETFYCFIVLEESEGVVVVIDVTLDPSLTQLSFPQATYAAQVIEGRSNATVVIPERIQALSLPINGVVSPNYRIIGAAVTSFAVLQSQTDCETFPVIVTRGPLRRIQQDYHELTLEASIPGVSAVATIGIQVLDINDQNPEFVRTPQTATIQEDALPGTEIARFQAVDPDVGLNGELYYSLVTQSPYFTLNPQTGSLYLFSQVNFETTQNSEIFIAISDLGHPTSNALQSNLTVFIADVNEFPPNIHVLGIVPITISEASAVGEVVIVVNVSDVDSLDVTLSIFTVDCNTCFQLSDNGARTNPRHHLFNITVSGPLDFEAFPNGYRITLTASDNGTPQLSTTYDLRVELTDMNEPPVFPQTRYNAMILEGASNGTEVIRLEALDPDTGTNGQLTYEITSSSAFGSWFQIDGPTGAILTVAEVDYEVATSVQLSISARDSPGNSTTAIVLISVLDRNDNLPQFSSNQYSVTVSESLGANESIFDFSATDNDNQCNGAVAYSLLFAEPEAFRIDSISGLLYPLNDSSLDFESFQEAVVMVRATDLADTASSYSADTTLQITLTNTNDARPVIDPIGCSCWIQENLPPGQICQRMTAHDLDSINLQFSISSGNELGHFSTNSATGIVSTTTSLDHEQEDRYILQIVARDGELESDPVVLVVLVVDVNDSPPMYNNPVMIVTTEVGMGEFVGSAAGEHLDVGYNGLTRYAFLPTTSPTITNKLKLDPLSGHLFAIQNLVDGDVFVPTVTATDLVIPTQSASTVVSVTILGHKNNPPTFATSVDHRTISSDTRINSTVTQVVAIDNDSGSNGQLMYNLVDGSTGVFQSTSTGSLILTQTLPPAGGVYNLNVSATDGGPTPLTAYQELILSVYPPIVSVDSMMLVHNPGVPPCHHSGTVAEDSGDVLVATLPPSQSSIPIMYRIVGGEFASAFRIDGVSVRTEAGYNHVFDRVQREAVYLTLRAEYGGNFHLCSLTVVIEDINNHGPEFSQSFYLVEVYSNTPIGTSIFTLQAMDADMGSNAETTYNLLSTSVPFTVNPLSGILETSGTLTQASYSLRIQAQDRLLPSRTVSATVNVIILQTSNMPPVITPTTNNISVPETFPIGSVVRTLVVADPDRGTHGQNNWCISSGNEHNFFAVNSNGQITVRNRLDYEIQNSPISLTITAFDSSPNPAVRSVQLTIRLTDENDETPTFQVPAYSGMVLENQLPGTPVITVRAFDRDEGSAGEVRYSISSNVPFNINSITGAITTSQSLNREATSSYSFSVTATDQPTTMNNLSSTVQVNVIVRDLNDRTPTIVTSNLLVAAFREDQEVGSEVIRLAATDTDEGPNGLVRYSIISGNSDRIFALDPWTGSITLARSVDYEEDSRNHQITYSANDLGIPSHTSTTQSLTFTILNVNDNYPLFSSAIYNCMIAESSSSFDPPCVVNAVDADTDDTIQYSIVSGNGAGVFQISATGILQKRPQGILDRETVPLYILQVRAQDSGMPRLSSTAIVQVNVQDTNDQIPQFDSILVQNGVATIPLPENLPVNTLIFFAHATDGDVGENADIAYRISQGDTSLFGVNPLNGAVFLTGLLDFESAPTHQLTILAFHPIGTSRLQQYIIQVIDVNENTLPPLFQVDNPPAVVIPRTTSPHSNITTLTATDGDPGPDGEVMYYVSGGTGYGYFQIDPQTGTVSTSYHLTGVQEDSLTLKITAFDGGSSPLHSSYELLIILEEDPDAKPFFSLPIFVATATEGNDARGSVFTFVQALVNDYADPSICYSIVDGDAGGLFEMNITSGAVSINSALDRELTPSYNLTVQASKPGISSTSQALLLINVGDINDFTPSFQQSFDVSVFANFPIDPAQSFMKVFAMDIDLSSSGQLVYTIQNQESLPFGITTSGEIYLTSTFNTSSYTVTVVATDQGEPSLRGSISILVSVVQEASPNNAVPSISIPSDINLPENTVPGTRIISVQTQDMDSPVLMYSIVNSPTEFAILPNSGEVYLTRTLDRELQQTYSLIVTVWDGGNTQPHTATAVVHITVTDINDQRPIFPFDQFFTVTEHSTVGTLAGTIVATDGDISPNNELTYFLVDSVHPSSLSLLSLTNNGMLMVAGDLDREVLSTHTLTVGVRDGGTPPLLNYTRVTVLVVDSNDHRPEIQFPFSNISIPEDTLVGSAVFIVATFDPDLNENGIISYTLNPPSVPFRINNSTGELVVTRTLDAETQLQYSLSITVYNPSNTSQLSPFSLVVNVFDVLDSPPSLQNPGSVSILENLPPYTIVANVADTANLMPVYYSIVGGQNESHFFIEPLTGIVRTSTWLDREHIPLYQITVQGRFDVGFESNMTFTVLVLDANDNPPLFSSRNLTYTLPENSIIQTSLFVVTDSDEGTNAQISTFYTPDNQARRFFTEQLDREGPFPVLTFDLYAFDSGTPQLYSTTRVTVTVADLNDHSPQFSQSEYSFTISAPAVVNTALFRVLATDLDEGSFADIRYSASGGNGTETFSLNPISGEVSVINNYMLQPFYSLIVVATDGGGSTASVTVSVQVKVCGFNDLLFQPRMVTLEIPENTASGTVIFTPTLLTFGRTATPQFYLSVADSSFNVNPISGSVTISEGLNHESQVVHQIVVQARDTDTSAPLACIAQVDIEILVTDVNDNRPEFVGAPYTAFVISSASINDSVVRVRATDQDEGSNAVVSYYLLSDPSNSFRIDRDSGVILVSSSLDAVELNSPVILTVEARDGGQPSLSSTATVSIGIVDSNAPRFTMGLYTVNISESAGRGSHVVTVQATAATGPITYRIDNDNANNPFRLDFYTGEVTVTDLGLDYERDRFYRIILEAQSDSLSGQAVLDIYILDVNDITPVFYPIGGFYVVPVNENVTIGTSILQVNATDSDSPSNAEVRYRLDTTNFQDTFFVDQTSGVITTTNTLDYEENPVYQFNVFALDSGSPQLTGTATVRIATININDNRPNFTEPTYYSSVSENASPGTSILFVTATDLDNDALTYRIVEEEGTRNFEVISSTGLITLNRSSVNLTREQYQLNVSAFDGLFFGFARVIVDIEDLNDNSPVFNQSVYFGSVVEGSSSGVYVTQVFATDADRGTNAEITYSSSLDVFDVNAQTGVVSTSPRSIDREAIPLYSFIIVARDGGGRTGTTRVQITVDDVNDTPPSFTQQTFVGNVVESAGMGTSVLTVTAEDPDAGDNGTVSFRIDNPNAQFPFRIDPSTGAIMTIFTLDHESTPVYTFHVNAEDRGASPLQAVPANVTIYVNDAADSPPVFTRNPYNISVREDLRIGSEVLTVRATTSTACIGIFYDILQAMTPVPFLLDRETGLIISVGSLDLDAPSFMGTYSFFIQAECARVTLNSGSLFGITSIYINVLDVNEDPEFTNVRNFYSGTIRENSPQLTPVVVTADGGSVNVPIRAIDSDLGDNGTVEYRLIELSSAPFNIIRNPVDPDSDDWLLITTGGLDSETQDRYQFRVEAYDRGTPPRSETKIVVVTVIDENDSPPEFNQSLYHVSIPEDTLQNTVIYTAFASDNDTDRINRRITYSLGSSAFMITNSTGEIRTITSLDRETTPSYTLEILANDGRNGGSAQLVINVTDINDSPPVFNSSEYRTTLLENFPPGVVFIQAFATDMDEGTNAVVTYSIVQQPNNGEVAINSSTGEITFVLSPDFEVGPRVEFQIRAADIGNLRGFATVVVILDDENDNPPVFSQESYTESVPENRTAGTNVGRVEATDEDFGSNGIFNYSIQGEGAAYFSINGGVILTTRPLDREVNSSFELLIVASDQGTPSLSTNVTFLINVMDVNDETPTFPNDTYSVSVSESEPEGYVFLFNVQAQDADIGTNADVTYRIAGEGIRNFMMIDNLNGSISIALAMQLNYERITNYELVLRAIDGGFPALSGTASLLVNVIDENDNPPEFNPPQYTVNIAENIVVGSHVTRVQATDADASDQLLFSIVNAVDSPEFMIDTLTGNITIAQTLDYETQTSYSFQVLVHDNDMVNSATATVMVTVDDVNDNPPIFLPHQSEFTPLENSQTPLVLWTLQADDADVVSPRERITYNIQAGNTGSVFAIEAFSGNLTIQGLLDREMVAHYNLTVTASDNGSPSLTGTTYIVVTVVDVNDNPPTGGHQSFYLYLLGGFLPDVTLGQVFAADPDTAEANMHTFRVLEQERTFFGVGADGTIRIATSTPTPGTYNYSVEITDLGQGAAITTVEFRVRNVSESMQASSFSMQISGVSPRSFVETSLQPFLSMVTAIMSDATSSAVEVHVFSIKSSPREVDSLDLQISAQNTTDSSSAQRATGDGFIHPNLVQHLIHLHRTDIENNLRVVVHTEHIDLCASEGCGSGEVCFNSFSYNTGNTVLGSTSVVYLGVRQEHTASCEDIQPSCSTLSCSEPSSCVEHINAGPTCFNDCTPDPCRNGGTCVSQQPGYYCICPEGYNGRNCEATSATFTGSSYAIFPTIQQRSNGTISLEVISEENNGLLFYSSRFDDMVQDFIALEVFDGLASLRVSYGGVGSSVQRLQGQPLNDRQWHTVVIQYNSSAITLSVRTFDPYTKNESTSSVTGQFYSLDLGAPLVLGHLPQEFKYDHQQTSLERFQFVGCLRNVLVNGQLLDFSAPLLESSVLPGCGFTDPQCSPNPCSNGGRCIGTWESFFCECPPQYSGRTCTEPSSSASFSGNNFIQYNVIDRSLARPSRQTGGSLYMRGQTFLSLSFTTTQRSGILLLLGDQEGSSEYAILETMDGHLQFRYNLGSGEAVIQQNTNMVSDGQFHDISVQRTEQSAELVIDNRYVNRTTSPGEEATLDILPDAIFLGAAAGPQGDTTNGFIGCIQGAKLDRKDLPFGGDNADFEATVSPGVDIGCPELGGLAERPQPAGYVYGVLAGVLGFLFLTSALLVATCKIIRWAYTRRRHTIRINPRAAATGRLSPDSLSSWQPTAFKRSLPLPHGEYRSTPQMGETRSDDFEHLNLHNIRNGGHVFPPRSSSPSIPSTPAFTETSFNEANNAPHMPATKKQPKPGTAHAQHKNKKDVLKSRNPGFVKRSPASSREENAESHHLRSPSAAQSVATERSDATSLSHDDVEVGHYLKKRLQAANLEIEERDYDEMISYKHEGKFEPLGSLGSLYDILQEDDSLLDQSALQSPHRQIRPTHLSPQGQPPTNLFPHSKPAKFHPSRGPPPAYPFPQGQINATHPSPHKHPPVHSRDLSKSSLEESYMGDYDKKLDILLERFHNMTTDFSSELDHQDQVEKRLV